MKKIEGYQIIKELGKGGMATVYLAKDEGLHREVALKVLRPETANQVFKKSFIVEGRTIAKLEHPHIIKINKINVINNLFYMEMEYLKNGTLEDRLKKTRLTPPEIVRIVEQIASALSYAHKKGYIHRDIKPANILFRDNGDAVLADFGIVKDESRDSDFTIAGCYGAIGTRKYMPPEQAACEKVDGRTDIYSLGIVVYEMLVREVPFKARNVIAMEYKHAKEAIPQLPTKYQYLQSVLDKAMAKTKEKRYESAIDFSNSLKNAYKNSQAENTQRKNSAHLHLNNATTRSKRRKISHSNNYSHSEDPFSDAPLHYYKGIIGIDFGTSTSLCSALIDGKAIIIPNQLGNSNTPSAIYINNDNSFIFGEAAVRAALRDPEHAVLQIKRLFGSNASFVANGKKYTVPQLAAEIIKSLIADCNKYLGAICHDVVITAPAYFTEIQLDDLRMAMELAGLNVKRIIMEPNAACLAFGNNIKVKGDFTVAVFDIGGGAFDISLVEMSEIDGVWYFDVLATKGENNLGGSDYDQTIINHCTTYFMKKTSIDLSNDLVAQMRLRDAAEAAKIELTACNKTVIHIPMIHADTSGIYDLTLPFSRVDFENITEHLTSKISHCCEEALTLAYLEKADITELILIGQATRTPLIRRKAEEIFGCKANPRVQSDKAVAVGAALQGGVLTGDIVDILLLNVVSHSLALELSDEIAPLIKANTTIPTKASQRFQTTLDQQTHAYINIVQENNKTPQKNIIVSTLIFSDITPLPAGEALIEVSFDIDANSCLGIYIKDISSNIEKSYCLQTPIFHSLDTDVVIAKLCRQQEISDDSKTQHAQDDFFGSETTLTKTRAVFRNEHEIT